MEWIYLYIKRTLCLFGTKYIEGIESSTASTSCKIYYLKVYEGDVLVHQYLPALHVSDNVTGMYDIIDGVFLTPSQGKLKRRNLIMKWGKNYPIFYFISIYTLSPK